MEHVLVPIFICVVLPVAIVLIFGIVSMNSDNKRAQILIKAIEANNSIDADKLAEALQKPKKSPREILNRRLLCGCVFALIGLFLCIVGIVNLCSGAYLGSDLVARPLIFGGLSVAVGISFLIVYFVSRKDV